MHVHIERYIKIGELGVVVDCTVYLPIHMYYLTIWTIYYIHTLLHTQLTYVPKYIPLEILYSNLSKFSSNYTYF